MTIHQDLYEYLKVHRLVSAQVGTRIFPQMAPTSATKPYITYDQISSDQQHHMDGPSRLCMATFDISVWSDSSEEMNEVAEAVRLALDGFRSDMLPKQSDITGIFLRNESDDFFQAQDGSQVGDFRKGMEYDIWYNRDVPTVADQPLRR